MVPHALRPRLAATKAAAPPVKAALFPLRTDAPAGLEGLELRVEKSGDRTVVNLRTRDGKPAPGTKLVGYVADASGLDAMARAVVLEPPANVENVTAA